MVRARHKGYAGADDAATVERPLLEGSLQLDFSDGPWLYRDLYFGMRTFTGIETVWRAGRPVWSMAYAGGMTSDGADMGAVYAFLRAALRAMPDEFPVRGPARFDDASGKAAWSYRMSADGDVSRFTGEEEILPGTGRGYGLRFAGGLVS
jgi:hypothetical protein